MGFHDTKSGAAATTFLALYVIFTLFSTFAVVRKGWKSVYFFLFFFGLIRIGAQISSVGFSILGYEGVNWLVAYLILGAEGYFTLLITALYFLFVAEVDKYGYSQFKPTPEQVKEKSGGDSRKARNIRLTSPAAIYHWILIPANALIISGGSMLTGVDPTERDKFQDKITTSKALRGTGQAVFLALNVVVGAVALYLRFKRDVRDFKLYAVMMAWIFLFARGLFGLLSVFIDSINYFDLRIYTENGLTSKFVACEYVLATTTEFIASCLLLSTYYFKNNHKYKGSEPWSKKPGSNNSDDEEKSPAVHSVQQEQQQNEVSPNN